MGEAIAGMGVPIAVGEPTTGLPVGCTAPDKFNIGLKALHYRQRRSLVVIQEEVSSKSEMRDKEEEVKKRRNG